VCVCFRWCLRRFESLRNVLRTVPGAVERIRRILGAFYRCGACRWCSVQCVCLWVLAGVREVTRGPRGLVLRPTPAPSPGCVLCVRLPTRMPPLPSALCRALGIDGWPACVVPLVDPPSADPDVVRLGADDYDAIPEAEREVESLYRNMWTKLHSYRLMTQSAVDSTSVRGAGGVFGGACGLWRLGVGGGGWGVGVGVGCLYTFVVKLGW
jgi:hypothetical protein